MKVVRDDDTPFTGTFRFDGYAFGDRLLEGVFFHGDATDGVIDFDTIRIAPDAADYFAGLNQKEWLKEAKDYVTETDVLETLDGKEDVWVVDSERPTVEPVEIAMTSFEDIIGGMSQPIDGTEMHPAKVVDLAMDLMKKRKKK